MSSKSTTEATADRDRHLSELERAIDTGDTAREREALRELRRLGVRVEFVRRGTNVRGLRIIYSERNESQDDDAVWCGMTDCPAVIDTIKRLLWLGFDFDYAFERGRTIDESTVHFAWSNDAQEAMNKLTAE